ncbi:MAG TPA: HU family DNA-binding protein [Dysgonamonadaceae bacterium]|nr:HU family DNA-binding protein [Dysgonamonadaceae bacterium]
MNKSELVSAVAQKSGLSKVDSKKALDAVLESIGEELKDDGKVVLVGFGTFSVTERSARKGINPRTKEAIDIPAKKVVKFKAGSKLSDLN